MCIFPQTSLFQMLVGMVFNVFGIVLVFIGTMVDGAQAGHVYVSELFLSYMLLICLGSDYMYIQKSNSTMAKSI